jgi:hypothetical protein
MIKTKYITKWLLIILINIYSANLFAQKSAQLVKSKSFVKIQGTSTIHDWEEKVLQFDSQLYVLAKGNELLKIEKAEFSCVAKSIESGNSLMNSKTWAALKAENHPEVIFELKTIEKLESKDGKFSCIVVGDIVIAGVKKGITFPVFGQIQSNVITVEGTKKIQMPEYSIVPPTAMLGAIKTGSEVKVLFLLYFQL